MRDDVTGIRGGRTRGRCPRKSSPPSGVAGPCDGSGQRALRSESWGRPSPFLRMDLGTDPFPRLVFEDSDGAAAAARQVANDGWSPTPTTRQTSAATDLKSLRTDGADVGRAAKVWHRPLGAIVLGNDRKPPRARRSFRSGRAERVSSATSAGGRRRRS